MWIPFANRKLGSAIYCNFVCHIVPVGSGFLSSGCDISETGIYKSVFDNAIINQIKLDLRNISFKTRNFRDLNFALCKMRGSDKLLGLFCAALVFLGNPNAEANSKREDDCRARKVEVRPFHEAGDSILESSFPYMGFSGTFCLTVSSGVILKSILKVAVVVKVHASAAIFADDVLLS